MSSSTRTLPSLLMKCSGFEETDLPYKFFDKDSKQWETGRYFTNKMNAKVVTEFASELAKLPLREQRLALTKMESDFNHKNAFDFVLSVSFARPANPKQLAINQEDYLNKTIDVPKTTTGGNLAEVLYVNYQPAKTVSDLSLEITSKEGKQLLEAMLAPYKDDHQAFVDEVLLSKNNQGEYFLFSVCQSLYEPQLLPLLLNRIKVLPAHMKEQVIKTENPNTGRTFVFPLLERFNRMDFHQVKEAFGDAIFCSALVHLNMVSQTTPIHALVDNDSSAKSKSVKFVCDELKTWHTNRPTDNPLARVFRANSLNENLLHRAARRKYDAKDNAKIIEHWCDLLLLLAKPLFRETMMMQTHLTASGNKCQTPLHIAVLSGDALKVKAFCSRMSVAIKCEIYQLRDQYYNFTQKAWQGEENVFHIAARKNDLATLQILLDEKDLNGEALSPEDKSKLLKTKNSYGQRVFIVAVIEASPAFVEAVADYLGPKGLQKEQDVYTKYQKTFLSRSGENKHFSDIDRKSYFDNLFKRRLALSNACSYLRERARERNWTAGQVRDLNDRLVDFKRCFEAAKNKEQPLKDPLVTFREGDDYPKHRKNFKLASVDELYADALFVEEELKAHPNSAVTKFLFPLLADELKAKKTSAGEKKAERRSSSPSPLGNHPYSFKWDNSKKKEPDDIELKDKHTSIRRLSRTSVESK